jgi:CheY-like chemotaxis protein
MEAIGTLAGGIAHDFNNLMMVILGNVSLMLLETDSAHPYHKKLENIEMQVKNGAKLTEQLLGYARKGKYYVKPISLNRLLKDTLATVSRTRKNIVTHLELDSDLYAIEADETQIEQVFLNLYVNAADAMPGGGDLFLKTKNISHRNTKNKPYISAPGKYVLLRFADSGVGIDKEAQKHIFDPFFTTKDMGRGTGLGLASVYGIIKGHGGYIDVESEKGRGTAFNIYLPASEKKVEKEREIDQKIEKGSETILLIDDEEMVLEVGLKMLDKLGYSVLQARNGSEAVKIYKKNKDKINLVVLDMVMPGMSGSEVYDKIKEINRSVKTLLSSGYSMDGEAKEILKRGCEGFIQKPFNLKEFSEKIREILGRK